MVTLNMESQNPMGVCMQKTTQKHKDPQVSMVKQTQNGMIFLLQ